MKKAITLVVVLAMASFFLNGCGESPESKAALKELSKARSDKDVTSSSKYNFSPFAGTVWKTKVKMAVADIKHYTNERAIIIIPPESFDPTHPKYTSSRDRKVVNEIPVGTEMRIEKLMEDQGVWGGVRVQATLQNGTNGQITAYLSEWLLANNAYLQIGATEATNWGVNPDMLEQVK